MMQDKSVILARNFTCTPASTNLRYTTGQDITGDIDCPHPTLFGIGTSSKKLCFTYDQLSTQLPNGVIDFEVSYDGVTYTDTWDQGANAGTPYTTSQNPWQAGDRVLLTLRSLILVMVKQRMILLSSLELNL